MNVGDYAEVMRIMHSGSMDRFQQRQLEAQRQQDAVQQVGKKKYALGCEMRDAFFAASAAGCYGVLGFAVPNPTPEQTALLEAHRLASEAFHACPFTN